MTPDGKQNALDQFLTDIQTEKYRPYTTGLQFFDDLMCGGLMRGTLTILLAAPGAGKTALCAQIGEAIAETQHRKAIYLNLEMSVPQMLARSISRRTTEKNCRVSALDVLQGYKWSNEQRATILESIEEYRERVAPYMQYYTGESAAKDTIIDAINKAGEQAKAKGEEAPAIILDYLHLLDGAGDDQQIIKQAVTDLKRYAIKYDTIVIAVSATNRDSNKQGRVTAASGRDTSGLEYTGDTLLGLNYYECETKDTVEHVNPEDAEAMGKILQKKTRRMVLRVLKGRFIPAGRAAELQFYAPGARFYGRDEPIPTDLEETPFHDDRTNNSTVSLGDYEQLKEQQNAQRSGTR